jgi:hypothetical protein
MSIECVYKDGVAQRRGVSNIHQSNSIGSFIEPLQTNTKQQSRQIIYQTIVSTSALYSELLATSTYHQTNNSPPPSPKMSAYFLHQPSRASLKLTPSIQTTSSTPRASTSTERSYDSLKSPILSEKNQTISSSSEKISRTPKKILQTIKQGWKEHHESVQASYEAYYGQGASTGRILGNAYQKK